MGLVNDIRWKCPECCTENIAQSYGEWDDPESGYDYYAVPLSKASSLKWNPPCSGCKKVKLKEFDISYNVCMSFEIVEEVA
jgi:hypothetical protein